MTKYRKGACTNCGAMTHSAKTCIERPRKIGAKFTGKNIGRDEVLEQVSLSWEAKRDQWNGYDPSEYRHVIEEYEMREQVRKEQRQKKLDEKLKRKAEKALANSSNGESDQKTKKSQNDAEDSDSSLELSSDSGDDSDKIP